MDSFEERQGFGSKLASLALVGCLLWRSGVIWLEQSGTIQGAKGAGSEERVRLAQLGLVVESSESWNLGVDRLRIVVVDEDISQLALLFVEDSLQE